LTHNSKVENTCLKQMRILYITENKHCHMHEYACASLRTISISVHELTLKRGRSCRSFCVCVGESSHSDLWVVIGLVGCIVQHLIVVKI
jgi:hypothetical protein